MTAESVSSFFHDLRVFWKSLVIVLTPIVLLPLVFAIDGLESRCGYAVLVMGVFWVTEALPLAVTALLPVVMFPTLGIMTGRKVAEYYIQDTTLTFMAGLMMALAIENVNLHKRLGTGILLRIGATPTRVLIGFMFPAWFLSMWISNTATTSMMIPAVEAVTSQLRLGMKKSKLARMRGEELVENAEQDYEPMTGGANNLAYDSTDVDNHSGRETEIDIRNSRNEDVFSHRYNFTGEKKTQETQQPNNGAIYSVNLAESQADNQAKPSEISFLDELESIQLDKEEEKKLESLSRMLSLAVAYSSNIGGTATLTGSPPNLLVAEAADRIYAPNSPVNYATWLFFGLPHSFICGIILWLWLQFYFLGWRSFLCKKDEDFVSQEKTLKNIMKAEYKKLGKLKFGEISCAVLLLIMVILWLTRSPGFMPGYAQLFKAGYVTDATPAILIAVILFAFPSEKPHWLCLRDRSERAKKVPSLLDWNTVSTKMPWGPLILIGGGFALAAGCQSSGLSEVVGKQLNGLATLDTWIIALIITTIMSFVTEIMSNTAVVALFLPILEALARDININPLYLMLPAGMAASYAFMLPIATPPNAIVFSFGHLKVIDMAKVGFIMNCLCILIVTLGINTWGYPIFDLGSLPWNTTTATTGAPP